MNIDSSIEVIFAHFDFDFWYFRYNFPIVYNSNQILIPDNQLTQMSRNQRLQFSNQDIHFNYEPKVHLKTTLTITNNTNTSAYFKIKLTRPKYYLIKPQKGFIQPNQNIVIQITLHTQAVPEAESDRIKCFYRFGYSNSQEPQKDWEKDQFQTSTNRFGVIVNGLPSELRRADMVKSSEVKSIVNSKFEGKVGMPSTLESMIRQKEGKLESLKKQVISVKEGSNKQENHLNIYIASAAVAFVVGILSSFWI